MVDALSLQRRTCKTNHIRSARTGSRLHIPPVLSTGRIGGPDPDCSNARSDLHFELHNGIPAWAWVRKGKRGPLGASTSQSKAGFSPLAFRIDSCKFPVLYRGQRRLRGCPLAPCLHAHSQGRPPIAIKMQNPFGVNPGSQKGKKRFQGKETVGFVALGPRPENASKPCGTALALRANPEPVFLLFFTGHQP